MIRKLRSILFSRLKRKSYALNQLDLKLLPYLDFRNGFFVEVGANDGINQSSTLYFERHRQWNGLLIEAIPALAEKCKKNRPQCITENCALVAFDYPQETVEMYYCNLMSVVKGAMNVEEEQKYIESGMKFLRNDDPVYAVSVPAKTLTEVLGSHHIQHIDLLSVDVEGYELEVLRGINFDVYTPRFLLVEAWHEKGNAIEATLENYYEQIHILDSNSMYSNILYRVR